MMRVAKEQAMRTAPDGPRRSVNLTLPAALINRARQAGLNLSGVAEAAIAAEVARVTRERVADEIRRGIELHHQLLAEHGSFAEQVLALRAKGDRDAG
jgi:post-segregation antitoxin (ccd killing protein)